MLNNDNIHVREDVDLKNMSFDLKNIQTKTLYNKSSEQLKPQNVMSLDSRQNKSKSQQKDQVINHNSLTSEFSYNEKDLMTITVSKQQPKKFQRQQIKTYKKAIITQNSYFIEASHKMAYPKDLFSKFSNQVEYENYKMQEEGKIIQKDNDASLFLTKLQKNKMRNSINSNNSNQYFSNTFMRTLQNDQLKSLVMNQHLHNDIQNGLTTKPCQSSSEIIQQRAYKMSKLPLGFSNLIQMLNVSHHLPQLNQFIEETNNKVTKCLNDFLIKTDSSDATKNLQQNLNKFLQQLLEQYFKKLMKMIVSDLTFEKLQLLQNQKTANILCLAKFCQENQFFQFVLRHNWPLLLLNLCNISFLDQNQQKTRFQKSILFIKNSIINKNNDFPQNFETCAQLISLLIQCFSKTNIFRQLLNKRVESSKGPNIKKTQLQIQKKLLQQKLKHLCNGKVKKTKKISKKQEKSKQPKKQLINHNKPNKKQPCSQNTKQDQHQITKQINYISNEIQKINRQQHHNCCFYLGKDKESNIFWFITYFQDKLFIQHQNGNWILINVNEIQQFLNYLDRTNIDENKLYDKINQFYRASIDKLQSKMNDQTSQNVIDQHKQMSQKMSIQKDDCNSQIQQEQIQVALQVSAQVQSSCRSNPQSYHQLFQHLNLFQIDKTSLLRMIQVGQKKMCDYLKDRNSKWGTQSQRQYLFQTIKSDNKDWIDQVKKEVSLFNQKVCVVQIQYKVFVEESTEQVDSKIKKIQTKIWGINQKYKHNWYQFISQSTHFTQIFFAVSVLYSLIKKYTSKSRKLRKQFQMVKQKTLFLSTNEIKQWKKGWNQICEICGFNGEILCCDFCPKSYHLQCINLPEIPSQQFKCQSCKAQITTRHQLKSISQVKKNKIRNYQ